MLVLSRKAGELIHIGNDIWVMVVAVKGKTVKLGITAPADMAIIRGEIGDRGPQRLTDSVCDLSGDDTPDEPTPETQKHIESNLSIM